MNKKFSLKKLVLGEQSIKEIETQLTAPKPDKKTFNEVVKKYKTFRESICGNKNFMNTVSEIKALIEEAEQVTLSETDGWFDNVTVNRHMKELKNSYKSDVLVSISPENWLAKAMLPMLPIVLPVKLLLKSIIVWVLKSWLKTKSAPLIYVKGYLFVGFGWLWE